MTKFRNQLTHGQSGLAEFVTPFVIESSSQPSLNTEVPTLTICQFGTYGSSGLCILVELDFERIATDPSGVVVALFAETETGRVDWQLAQQEASVVSHSSSEGVDIDSPPFAEERVACSEFWSEDSL